MLLCTFAELRDPGLHAALTAPDIDTDSAVGTSIGEEVSECMCV